MILVLQKMGRSRRQHVLWYDGKNEILDVRHLHVEVADIFR